MQLYRRKNKIVLGTILIAIGFPVFLIGIKGYAQYSAIAAFYDSYLEIHGRPLPYPCNPYAAEYNECPMARPSPALPISGIVPSSTLMVAGAVIMIRKYSNYVPKPIPETENTATTDGTPFK